MHQLYEIGQYVYTSKNIRGWFDHSLSDIIPKNTMGIVKGYYAIQKDINSVVYEVEFEEEFGIFQVIHSCLKLEEDD